jgi:hypothetical protein
MGAAAPPTADAPSFAGHSREPLVQAATLWIMVGTVGMTLFSLAEQSLPVFVSFAVFGAAGWLVSRLMGSLAARIFVVVFGASCLAAIALYYYYIGQYGVPYLFGGSDDLHYETKGQEFAETLGLLDYGSIRGNLVAPWHNSVGYIYVVGLLYKFAQLSGEVHTMVPRLFNIAMLGLTAVGIFRLAYKLQLSQSLAIACGLLAGCLPLMMYVSVQTLRDIFVTALLVAVVNLWTPMRGRKIQIIKAGLLTLVCVVLLIDMRRPQALVTLMVGVIGFLASDTGRRPIIWIPTLLVAIGAAVGAFVVLSSVLGYELLYLAGQSEYYNAYRVDATGGGLSTVVFSTPPPLGWILRTAYALASPFPEMSLDLDKVWISAGTAFHLMFVPFLFAGLGVAMRDRRWWPVLGSMVLLFIGMAMFTFQGRHIVQYLPFAVLLAALGYLRLARVRTTVFTVTISLGAVLAAIYLLLKSW